MVAPLTLALGMRHGDTCTCRPLDPITVTAQPVIVNPDCPRQREVPRSSQIQGRIVITWPAPSVVALPAWNATVHDADTGTPWQDVIRIRINVEPGDSIVTADLERLVDEDGQPDPTGRGKSVPTEDGTGYRTAVLRYAVAEMRLATTVPGEQPATPAIDALTEPDCDLPQEA